MPGTWRWNSDHSTVPTFKEFVGNSLDTQDNQKRKLRVREQSDVSQVT